MYYQCFVNKNTEHYFTCYHRSVRSYMALIYQFTILTVSKNRSGKFIANKGYNFVIYIVIYTASVSEHMIWFNNIYVLILFLF